MTSNPAASALVVLLVDDSIDDQELVRRVLRSFPELRLVAADNGEEALRYFAQPRQIPNLVLLDLKMPKLDGFEVLKWMRSQPALREIPVVVFSSSDQPNDIERAMETGATDYATKPVSFDQHSRAVLTLVSKYLDLPSSGRMF